MNKWISRKLFVALIAVGAIVWSIHTGDSEVESQVIDKGNMIADAAIALISAVYIIAQGKVDRGKV